MGIKATNAIINVAIVPNLLSKVEDWKNIARLIIPRSQRGMKIVARETDGCLYSGILKCAYWKYLTFWTKASDS